MIRMMRERGTAGRRFGLVVALAAIAAMAYAGVSLAASDVIVAGPADTYSQPAYNTDQGAVVQFQDNGGSHNVTARQAGPDGKALFRSPTITGGTVPIEGTQYLQAGDYPFFCTVHPTTMNGTLHVTGAGAALARPSATLKLRTKTISKAVKKGLLVAVTAGSQVDGVTLTAKLGKATIGSTRTSLTSGAQTKTVKLSKAGKSKLRKKSTAKVSVTADLPFGAPASAKAKLK
jgi:plastocyanin